MPFPKMGTETGRRGVEVGGSWGGGWKGREVFNFGYVRFGMRHRCL